MRQGLWLISAMTSRDRKAVIVLGMHRSGTSALSGALNIAGIDFASESKHFDADSNVNAKGYCCLLYTSDAADDN